MYRALIELKDRLADFTPKLVCGIAIFILFYIAAVICRKAVLTVCRNRDLDRDVTNFLAQAAKISLLVVGGITALGTMHVNVSALVAGLGLTGFALGFALKDLISNLIAGVLILVYRPFQRGDSISVTGFEGTVIGIDLRYTSLQKEDTKYLVPNAILLSKGISVVSSQDRSTATAATKAVHPAGVDDDSADT